MRQEYVAPLTLYPAMLLSSPRLTTSLLNFLHQNPSAGHFVLCMSEENDVTHLFYDTHDRYLMQGLGDLVETSYYGLAAKSIREYFNQHNITGNAQAEHQLFLALQALDTATNAVDQVRELADVVSCAYLIERVLNDSMEKYLQDQIICLNNGATTLEQLRNGVSLTVGVDLPSNYRLLPDDVNPPILTSAHIRPLKLAGLWIDLRSTDDQAPLQVALAFDDTRFPGARNDVKRVKYCTNEACLYFGIKRNFLLSATHREWADKGLPFCGNEFIKFMDIKALPHCIDSDNLAVGDITQTAKTD